MNSRSEIRRLAISNPDKLIEEIEKLRAENMKLNEQVSILKDQNEFILVEELRRENEQLKWEYCNRCGNNYPQRCSCPTNQTPILQTQNGWKCPICSSVYAPWYPKCDKCGDKK